MASIRHTVRPAWPLPLQLIIGGLCVLLMLQDHPHHVAEATIPTIDNIVKILQSPVVQQLILPRPLVAADPSVVADEPAAMPAPVKMDPKKPSHMSDEKAKASSKDGAQDETVRTFLIPRTRSLPGCPLCDASVYSYCDEKVYHDACCCGSINGAAPFGGGGGFGGFGGFGRQGVGRQGFGGGGCGYQGCSFLYANSCYEHQLIVNCCCNSPY
ncbi:uncharacterized protein LOC128299733 [Anopheles moucheti]|uniref:uncharacterized protein LOC128299733 n=1 Tax=Anopheles moucheti TaxID=186751 RepID=UPI0022EFEFCE|nr:uncharacterized protein LOC128299733 [Anopheles moucheti]